MQHSVDRKEGIGGITIPWLYIGMRFSTFCWHVEDCAINSINYNHQSGIKTWYVVPGAEKEKFDHFLASKGKKDLLGKITLMIDPLELEAQHIRVYKAYQRPGEYICTFFNAYHCGFSQGFNVGEAANFITVKSIPYIKSTTEQNIINKNPSLFCLQWLL